MKKEDVVWYEDEEYPVMEDSDGWKIILIANHFKYKFAYDIETPDGYTLGLYETDIYKAIDRLNEEKKTYMI